MDERHASLADRSTRQRLTPKPEQSNIFFKRMEERYRRRSTVITTNLDYDEGTTSWATGPWWKRC